MGSGLGLAGLTSNTGLGGQGLAGLQSAGKQFLFV